MQPTTLLAGVTFGVAASLAAQNLWRWIDEGDPAAPLRAVFASMAGIMTVVAGIASTATGEAKLAAIDARTVTMMAIVPVLMRIIGLVADRRPPAWLMVPTTVGALAAAVLSLTTDLYTADRFTADGVAATGPLYAPLTLAIGVLIVLWVVMAARATPNVTDRAALVASIVVPAVFIVGSILIEPSGRDTEWVVALAPVLLAAEVVRWRDGRRRRAERRRAAREREVLAQELTRTNDELRSALRARTDLIDATSHELRTPLTAIIGFGQTLRDHAGELDPVQQQEAVTRIVDNTMRLRGVVDGMLAARTLRSTTFTPLPDVVALRPVLEAATTLFSQLDAGVEIDCPGELTTFVDPLHLPRIITAVVANAATHGAPPLQIVAREEAGLCTVLFRDAGPGVPAELKDRLFDPFERATSGLTRTPGGIGLGLANARALAISCNGDLWLDDSESGATFRLTLPAGPQPPTDVVGLDADVENGTAGRT